VHETTGQGPLGRGRLRAALSQNRRIAARKRFIPIIFTYFVKRALNLGTFVAKISAGSPLAQKTCLDA
jgi:hypothetical protein